MPGNAAAGTSTTAKRGREGGSRERRKKKKNEIKEVRSLKREERKKEERRKKKDAKYLTESCRRTGVVVISEGCDVAADGNKGIERRQERRKGRRKKSQSAKGNETMRQREIVLNDFELQFVLSMDLILKMNVNSDFIFWLPVDENW